MPRPIVLGVVGDSGAGKTTLTRGLVRVLGDGNVAHLSADDYHRYDRRERRNLGISPLHPDANYLDILTQHLGHLRRGNPVLKPVYDHREGTLGRPHYVRPAHYLVVEGLLELPHRDPAPRARRARVPRPAGGAAPGVEELKRDCTRRGYTTDEVLSELDHRQRDAEAFIRPQRRTRTSSSLPAPHGGDPANLDAEVVLRDTLPHPDLAPLVRRHRRRAAPRARRARAAAADPGRHRPRPRRPARGGGVGSA